MAGTLVKRLEFPTGGEFLVVLHDLLEEPVDCIGNAANGGLSHGGGVAAAIAMAAGPELDMESGAIVRERGWIPTGEAVVTTAGKLPFKGIIHTEENGYILPVQGAATNIPGVFVAGDCSSGSSSIPACRRSGPSASAG